MLITYNNITDKLVRIKLQYAVTDTGYSQSTLYVLVDLHELNTVKNIISAALSGIADSLDPGDLRAILLAIFVLLEERYHAQVVHYEQWRRISSFEFGATNDTSRNT